MRRILYISFFLAAAVLVGGCSQQVSPAATPTLTLSPTPSPLPSTTIPVSTVTTPGPVLPKHIDLSAFQSGSDVIVKYTGGADAGDLTALEISVQSYTGQTRNEREENPVVGQQYVFPQMGTPDPDVVTVTGFFSTGTEQVLLQTKV